MSVGIPCQSSTIIRSISSPGQLLLADRRYEELPPFQPTAEPTERTNEEVTADGKGEDRQTDHPHLITAALPRVSCCLLDASMALSERRIADLCAQLEQASAILNEVIAVVCPEAKPAQTGEETAARLEEPQVNSPAIFDDGDLATVTVAQTMAAAA